MNKTRTKVAAGVGLAAIVAVGAFILLPREPAPLASSPSPSSATTPEPTAEATLNQELLSERLTVLLIGLDSSEGRRARGAGLNTDTLMLASVSADQSAVTLLSLPRDTVDIPLPDGTTWNRKVNAIYVEEGVDALVGAMESLFGVPIDGYVQIDMDDLEALVDAADGVRVAPDEPLVDAHLDLDMPAGRQLLDGETALDYVRTRVDSDYARAGRQQEILLDLVRRLVDPATDVDVAQLLDGLASFQTDLPLDDLPTLLEIGRRAQDAEVTRRVLGPPGFVVAEGDFGDGRGYVIIPDIDAMRRVAARTIGD